jgi:CRP-like cAMP-binding protein
MKNRRQQEELIQKCLVKNNKRVAIELLFRRVAACAKDKDFKSAEALRGRMFEIDPMALSAIIGSADIIDAAKNEAIDKHHRKTWSALYNNLNLEEANAFYFALKSAVYGTNETVFEQGEHKSRLFFINSGRPKLIYSVNGAEVFLKLLSPGQITGEDTFFSDTVCTTSMITLSRVELSYLEPDVLRRLKKDFPVLESKLLGFVSKSEKICDLIQARELDRRCQKRISIRGVGTAPLVNSARIQVGEVFRVNMCDVSQGGVSFTMGISNKEMARHLVGRTLRIRYRHPQLESAKAINEFGVIVAVRFNPYADCSVHVKFDGRLRKEIIEALSCL